MPSEPIIWIVIGIIIAVQAYDKARTAWKRRNGNPGNYGEKIGRLEERMEGVEEDVKAIKDRLNLV